MRRSVTTLTVVAGVVLMVSGLLLALPPTSLRMSLFPKIYSSVVQDVPQTSNGFLLSDPGMPFASGLFLIGIMLLFGSAVVYNIVKTK